MSIYATTFSVGEPEDGDPGVVLTHPQGVNRYPRPGVFLPASIDGARIPGWCAPGRRDDVGWKEPRPAPWYRLGVSPWPDERVEVLLDEDAARALRDDLTDWLDLPKSQPKDGAE